MSRLIDLIGQKFGRLIAIQRMDNNKYGNSCWLCRCDCGKEKIVIGISLRNRNTKSCGCLNKDKRIERFTKHGHKTNKKSSKTYRSWDAMIQRCINSNNNKYKIYGDRGITVCRHWMKFLNFLKDMGEVPPGYQIDRINNNGNYCKSNCRWVTPKQQGRNRRNNHLISFNGKIQCLSKWAEETGFSESIIRYRLKVDWSIEKALTTQIRKQKRNKND